MWNLMEGWKEYMNRKEVKETTGSQGLWADRSDSELSDKRSVLAGLEVMPTLRETKVITGSL